MITRPLAPALGHLADPPSSAPFDDIRLVMLEELLVAPGDQGWLMAWECAATAIRDRVVASAREEMLAAGRRSRYPTQQLASMLPSDEAADGLLHRLLAEGMPLERLEGSSLDAAGWRGRGAAIEVAWDGAVRIGVAERGRWRGAAAGVAGWRRPWRPLVIAGSALVLAATLLAAVLGGFLPAPRWFAPVVDAFWEVPWP
jgi:hypothetical protein